MNTLGLFCDKFIEKNFIGAREFFENTPIKHFLSTPEKLTKEGKIEMLHSIV